MDTLNSMAAKGKQQRVNTPLFGWDLVRFRPFFPLSFSTLTCSSLTQGFDDWYPEQAKAKLAAGGYN
jgi:glycerol 2-dehydrogenase (NADP+)